ncbi:hypothetical protein KUCAC02_009184, partial [Chaenocephalus aceratus]
PGIGNWQQLWAVPFIVCQPPDPAMPPWGLSDGAFSRTKTTTSDSAAHFTAERTTEISLQRGVRVLGGGRAPPAYIPHPDPHTLLLLTVMLSRNDDLPCIQTGISHRSAE